jgi:hypothetical protein
VWAGVATPSLLLVACNLGCLLSSYNQCKGKYENKLLELFIMYRLVWFHFCPFLMVLSLLCTHPLSGYQGVD